MSRRSAGVIDWMIAAIRSRSLSSTWLIASFIWPMPGQHPEQVADRPHLAHGLHLLEEVLERRSPRRPASCRPSSRPASASKCLLGLLDQGEHVAHAEDARGHPLGVEDVEVGELLAAAGEQDRHAGEVADRQRRAAAGVAVELGEDDAGEPDAVLERLRGDRPRPGRPSRRRRTAPRRAAPRRGCRPPAASARRRCRGDRRCRRRRRRGRCRLACAMRLARDVDRVADAAARLGREARRPRPARRRPAAAGRRSAAAGRRRRAAARGPAPCSQRASLPASVVLPAPCRPASMITVGGRLRVPEPAGLAAEDGDELLVDDLDDLLGRVERRR